MVKVVNLLLSSKLASLNSAIYGIQQSSLDCLSKLAIHVVGHVCSLHPPSDLNLHILHILMLPPTTPPLIFAVLFHLGVD